MNLGGRSCNPQCPFSERIQCPSVGGCLVLGHSCTFHFQFFCLYLVPLCVFRPIFTNVSFIPGCKWSKCDVCWVWVGMHRKPLWGMGVGKERIAIVTPRVLFILGSEDAHPSRRIVELPYVLPARAVPLQHASHGLTRCPWPTQLSSSRKRKVGCTHALAQHGHLMSPSMQTDVRSHPRSQ